MVRISVLSDTSIIQAILITNKFTEDFRYLRMFQYSRIPTPGQ